MLSIGAYALDTECALNAHSIHIDRVRTRNVKVQNRIECALSQSTFVCRLNPVRSGLEWNVGGHDGCVHVHSRARSVSGTQLMTASWDFVDLQNQFDEIVRNKAI